MAKYKLYHRETDKWVTKIDFDMDYYENHGGEIVGINTLEFDSEKDIKEFRLSKVELSDNMPHWSYNDPNPEYKIYSSFGLERIYEGETSIYWSGEINCWLTEVSGHKGNFHLTFSPEGTPALEVRDKDIIEWIEKHTQLEKYKLQGGKEWTRLTVF